MRSMRWFFCFFQGQAVRVYQKQSPVLSKICPKHRYYRVQSLYFFVLFPFLSLCSLSRAQESLTQAPTQDLIDDQQENAHEHEVEHRFDQEEGKRFEALKLKYQAQLKRGTQLTQLHEQIYKLIDQENELISQIKASHQQLTFQSQENEAQQQKLQALKQKLSAHLSAYQGLKKGRLLDQILLSKSISSLTTKEFYLISLFEKELKIYEEIKALKKEQSLKISALEKEIHLQKEKEKILELKKKELLAARKQELILLDLNPIDQQQAFSLLLPPMRGKWKKAFDSAQANGIWIDGQNLDQPMVHSILEGEVLLVQWINHRLKYVIVIAHIGAIQGIYGSLESPMVKKGERVKQQQAIAKLSLSKPQLYFELRKAWISIAPQKIMMETIKP